MTTRWDTSAKATTDSSGWQKSQASQQAGWQWGNTSARTPTDSSGWQKSQASQQAGWQTTSETEREHKGAKSDCEWGSASTKAPIDSSGWQAASERKGSKDHKSTRRKINHLIQDGLGPTEANIHIFRKQGDEEYFMKWKWGNRVKIREVNLSQKETFEKTCIVDGKECFLTVVKVEKKKGLYNPNIARAYYLAELDTRAELEQLGDFSKLSVNKAISRLQLMVSPARWAPKNAGPYHILFGKDEFELKEENGNMGCGFIPKEMLEKYFGGAPAIQVRIIGPTLGWFKGTLTMKLSIDKIELPGSMQKVEASTINKEDNWVYFLCKQVFPSKLCKQIGCYMNPKLSNPSLSAEKKLKNDFLEGNMRPKMLSNLLLSLGVPQEVISEYGEQSKTWERRNHGCCVGLADPTDAIPEGHIFVTGFGQGNKMKDVFITRYPNTEKKDGLLVPIVTKRPKKMSKENWDMLCSHEFGFVFFSCGPELLPAKIADGDLDGDLYFICWDHEIIGSIKRKKHKKQKTTESVNDDDFVGAEFFETIHGRWQHVVVEEKLENNIYRVHIGNEYQNMSQDEIETFTKDKFSFEKITNHRGTGINMEVEILFTNGNKQWQVLNSKSRQVYEDSLVNYAVKNNLLDEVGWKWIKAKELTRDSCIVKVTSHRRREGKWEAEILFDDQETMWDTVGNIMQDEDDARFLYDYAKENNLLNTKGWMRLKNHERDWFKDVQDSLADVNSLWAFDKLTATLHSAYIRYRKDLDTDDSTSIALGNAFKQSIDIRKHGGKVELPFHLRDHIKNKNLHKYITMTMEHE